MKQFILKHYRSFAGIVACLLIGVMALSFQDSPIVKIILDNQQTEPLDTIKKKKHSMSMKEFDRLSEQLDLNVMEQINQIDFANIEHEVLASLQQVDINKILIEVEASLKNMNVEKILDDIKKELKNINYDKVSDETRQALVQANKEIDEAIKEINKTDRSKIIKELEQAKREVEKSRTQLENIDMGNILKKAKEGIEKAKSELKQLKEMFTEMEADGLINSKQGFKIEYKDKELYINGNRQTEQVTDKYRKYFKEEHFEISIDKE